MMKSTPNDLPLSCVYIPKLSILNYKNS
jgi:hypothetical protein